MFELLLVLVFLFVSQYLAGWWFWLGFVILLSLILPGMYAMIFGAPNLPSGGKRIAAILKLGNFSSGDTVYDLGCGDGGLIRAIAGVGVKRALGLEFSVPTFFVAWLLTVLTGSRARIRFANFWRADLRDADVLVCFLLERTMLDFERKIWPGLRSGTRVISNEFKMSHVEPVKREGGVYLYVKK